MESMAKYLANKSLNGMERVPCPLGQAPGGSSSVFSTGAYM